MQKWSFTHSHLSPSPLSLTGKGKTGFARRHEDHEEGGPSGAAALRSNVAADPDFGMTEGLRPQHILFAPFVPLRENPLLLDGPHPAPMSGQNRQPKERHLRVFV